MTIDSNIVIGYLNGDPGVVDTLTTWRKQGTPLFLPTIVEAEVLSFRGFSEQEQTVTERFLEENFIPIGMDRPTARTAARLRRETKMKLPDAIIAATALMTRTPLVTRNVKDFRNISRLRLIPV